MIKSPLLDDNLDIHGSHAFSFEFSKDNPYLTESSRVIERRVWMRPSESGGNETEIAKIELFTTAGNGKLQWKCHPGWKRDPASSSSSSEGPEGKTITKGGTPNRNSKTSKANRKKSPSKPATPRGTAVGDSKAAAAAESDDSSSYQDALDALPIDEEFMKENCPFLSWLTSTTSSTTKKWDFGAVFRHYVWANPLQVWDMQGTSEG